MTGFFLDHNVSPRVAVLLRAAGHFVMTAREAGLQNATDRELLLFAARLGLAIVTADSADFEILHETESVDHAGILLVRQTLRKHAAVLAHALDELASSGFSLVNELYTWSPDDGWICQS